MLKYIQPGDISLDIMINFTKSRFRVQILNIRDTPSDDNTVYVSSVDILSYASI